VAIRVLRNLFVLLVVQRGRRRRRCCCCLFVFTLSELQNASAVKIIADNILCSGKMSADVLVKSYGADYVRIFSFSKRSYYVN